MTIRLVSATAVAALIAAGAATAAPAAFRSCGTVRGGGATWQVVGVGVPCSAAKPLVRKLAAKPHPGPATRLGTHIGLKCVEFAGKSKREIACVGKNDGRSVFGVTPARK